MVDTFKGYNHNLRIGEGEFFDMKNMTSDHYPLLAPEMSGKATQADSSILGMVSNNGLCYVRDDGNKQCSFHIEAEGETVQVDVELDYRKLIDGKKKLVNMGAYVVILPDKKWVNVAACLDNGSEDADKYGSIEAEYQNTSLDVAAVDRDGNYVDFKASTSRPEDPKDGDMWLDISQAEPVLKKWYKASAMWMEEQSYVALGKNAYFSNFNEGDCLVGKAIKRKDDDGTYLSIPENPVVVKAGKDNIVLKGVFSFWGNGMGDYVGITDVEVHWTRKMPDLDYITESNNRLWGCKYGQTEDGFINEIYASKLGDFKNWTSFQGISTDSYRASIGEDGRFTGAATYNGRPVFFKDDCMIQVYGAYPAQYQTNVVKCNGIRDGCAKSAAVVDNRLYYYSRNGVCMYDGSLPVIISEPLGKLTDKEVLGGGAGSKYYLLGNGGRCYVFDAMRGMWHLRQIPADTSGGACEHDGDLFLYKDNNIYRVLGTGAHGWEDEAVQEPVEWMVESGDIGLTTPDAKYISRLDVRMSLAEGSEVSFFVKYDFEDEWYLLTTMVGTNLRSFVVPIRPKRCDTMRLRIEGIGDAKIYSLVKTIEQGGDVH
jgi:hypothetical protein